ncbi:aminotransferase class I/II-fold pyridoxal phosphate-dependent enzyme [Amycolatopsis plumensis]|uniref:aminotransferase class I/II-fold pyridoxal phosphate-dependent enzyme n=1 Tax=Amycolatopsis plumensis TaxID=236508 RepID=UPI00360CC214
MYEGDHLSLAASERQLPVEKRIVHSVFTFSKSLAMTGYRLGYVVPATDEAAAGMRVVQEAGIIALRRHRCSTAESRRCRCPMLQRRTASWYSRTETPCCPHFETLA